MSRFSTVGDSSPRLDGLAKVRGTLGFPSDVYPKDALRCRPVFTPHPHARILGVQFDEALTVPGVVRVLTARDLRGKNHFGHKSDRPIYCADKSRYEGDVVAVVVAESEAAAEAGARRVKVDYAPLPLLTDPEQALLPGAPLVHESGNILNQFHFAAGDPESALARDDVVVIERTYATQVMDHAFLETEAGVAFPEDGGVKVITSGQNPYYHRGQIAQALGLPPEKVRVIEPYAGGSFGGKVDINVQIHVALAAYLTGRPCRMMWTRREHFVAGVKRQAAVMKLRTAATRDGQLVALQARAVLDKGAYAVNGEVLLNVLVENLSGPYHFPNVRMDAWSVFTNNYVGGAFRGFGAGKPCFAIEGQMSALARALGLDEVAFRQRNLVKTGGLAGIGHKLIAPVHVEHTLKAVAQHPLWARRQQLDRGRGPIRRGIGVALSMKGYGLGIGGAPDFGTAELTLGFDGRVRLGIGTVDFGQGSFTALAQIAAEALNCDLSSVDVRAADTQEVMDFGPTSAQRVTFAIGRAAITAAEELKVKIRKVAAEAFRVRPESLEINRGLVKDPASGRSMTFAQIAQQAEELLEAKVRERMPYSEEVSAGGLAHPHVLFSSFANVAQVAVDTETGQVTVERVVAFPELGQVVNRLTMEGQCDGGTAQGLGYALMEHVAIQEGRNRNPDLTTYAIPTALDTPAMETVPVEVPEVTGPFGAKGFSENATLPAAPAILDAIEDAIGIRFTSLPVTPEQIVEALAQAGAPADAPGRVRPG